MKTKTKRKNMTDEAYYGKQGVLGEIAEGAIALSLDDALREEVMSGKRKRKLRNISTQELAR